MHIMKKDEIRAHLLNLFSEETMNFGKIFLLALLIGVFPGLALAEDDYLKHMDKGNKEIHVHTDNNFPLGK